MIKWIKGSIRWHPIRNASLNHVFSKTIQGKLEVASKKSFVLKINFDFGLGQYVTGAQNQRNIFLGSNTSGICCSSVYRKEKKKKTIILLA